MPPRVSLSVRDVTQANLFGTLLVFPNEGPPCLHNPYTNISKISFEYHNSSNKNEPSQGDAINSA